MLTQIQPFGMRLRRRSNAAARSNVRMGYRQSI